MKDKSELSMAVKEYKDPILRNRMYSIMNRKMGRFKILSKLGNQCAKCGINDERLLQIDHINNDGANHRKEFIPIKWHNNKRKREPSNVDYYKKIIESINKNECRFQLLCANCNWLKRY